jgi:RNA polymerase sigma-70 factor (ECF subfamily)
MKASVSHSLLLRSSDALTDAELVGRALGGDRWGREMLYRRHAAYLLGMTARLLANRGEAEEVVQDTFVTAFAQLATLREPSALRAWLSQIAVSLVRRRIRRVRFLRLLGLDRGADDATMDALAAPGTSADQHCELALLDRVLGGMKAPSRIAWMLRRVEGLKLSEVATVCRCSLATAKRRISDADALVRRHVGLPEGES